MSTDPPLADPTSRLPAPHAPTVKANTLAIASDPTAVPPRPAVTRNAHIASTPRSTHAPTAPLSPRVCPLHSHPESHVGEHPGDSRIGVMPMSYLGRGERLDHRHYVQLIRQGYQRYVWPTFAHDSPEQVWVIGKGVLAALAGLRGIDPGRVISQPQDRNRSQHLEGLERLRRATQ